MFEWIEKNQQQFEVDLLQQFCEVAIVLNEQFLRYRSTKSLSFSILVQLIGTPIQKGILWDIKDKAHLTLGRENMQSPVAVHLDWVIGYIFHESIKLVEDSRLYQHYMPRLGILSGSGLHTHLPFIESELHEIESQTQESIHREITRIERLFILSRNLFCSYFFGKSSHRPLARLLYSKNSAVISFFSDMYSAFLSDIYGNTRERLYLEAAYSLEESGRFRESLGAVHRCLIANPTCGEALVIKERIHSKVLEY